MRRIKLTRDEREIENNLEHYVSVSREDINEMAHIIKARKKNAVLNIRVNSEDLKNLKQKAARMGLKYQTFISEILRKVAKA